LSGGLFLFPYYVVKTKPLPDKGGAGEGCIGFPPLTRGG